MSGLCSHKSPKKIELFNSLQISIPPTDQPTVGEGVKIIENQVERVEHSCENCQKRDATKVTKLKSTLDTLIIQIKRFQPDQYGLYTKNSTRVHFTSTLTIENKIYELYAFINHIGTTTGGHYTACCRDTINEDWRHYNDSKVTQLSAENMERDNAYILFYKHTAATEEHPTPTGDAVQQEETEPRRSQRSNKPSETKII